MVVSASPAASIVGREVLDQGGNAVDAAVAVGLALAVTWPEAGNIGGGGFMLVKAPGGEEPVCIEYRECAPLQATATMYQEGDSTLTHRAVGVPGTVRGLALAHHKFGQLNWKEVTRPAVRLAREGFPIDAALAQSLNELLAKLDATDPRYATTRATFACPAGRTWQPGDRLVQPALARTLELIAEHGPDGFYRGAVAELIVAEMQRGEGLLTLRDLAEYEARVRRAVHGRYGDYDVWGPPLPSSGGVCLALALNMLSQFDLGQHERSSPEVLHWTTETMRRVYCDRARWLGDPDYSPSAAHLLDPRYAQQRAADISNQQATDSKALAPDLVLDPESESTTHFSIVDRHGLVVSNTYTLEASYGSRIVVRGAGFLLNNEMGDFNWFPGQTTREGRIGTLPNRIAPRKRMLSSQTPVIITRGGQPILVTGSPGGRTIINTVLAVVLNRIEFELEPAQCVQAARWHHQWLPDVLTLEPHLPALEETVATLRSWGHAVGVREGYQGSAHSIFLNPQTGERHGVADGRRSGFAAGQ